MSCGSLQFRSRPRRRENMSWRSASITVAGTVAMLLILLLFWSVGFRTASASACSVSALPITASSAVDPFGGKRVLCGSVGTALLSSPSRAAAATAAAVVVVVFSEGLVLLLAVPVMRLGSFVVDGMFASSFSTACLLRCFSSADGSLWVLIK